MYVLREGQNRQSCRTRREAEHEEHIWEWESERERGHDERQREQPEHERGLRTDSLDPKSRASQRPRRRETSREQRAEHKSRKSIAESTEPRARSREHGARSMRWPRLMFIGAKSREQRMEEQEDMQTIIKPVHSETGQKSYVPVPLGIECRTECRTETVPERV